MSLPPRYPCNDIPPIDRATNPRTTIIYLFGICVSPPPSLAALAPRPLYPSAPMYYHRVSSGRPIGTKEAVVAKNPTTAVVAGELVPPSGGRRAVCGAATMFYS